METQAPIIAFLYDFDKTLCTTDMEDYAFIPSLGYTPAEFWGRANAFGWENRMDGLLAYMYTMLREAARRNRPFTRTDLVEKGRSIVLFPGVEDWFRRINDFGAGQGVQPELRLLLDLCLGHNVFQGDHIGSLLFCRSELGLQRHATVDHVVFLTDGLSHRHGVRLHIAFQPQLGKHPFDLQAHQLAAAVASRTARQDIKLFALDVHLSHSSDMICLSCAAFYAVFLTGRESHGRSGRGIPDPKKGPCGFL